MPSQSAHRERASRARRLAVVSVGILLAASTWAGQAYAQTPDGPSAVDQYVEDVPTSGGSAIPGKNKPKNNSLPPRVSNQIASQGGSDAQLLQEVATSPDYGAPAATAATKPKKAGAKGEGKANAKGGAARTAQTNRDETGSIPPPTESSPSEAVSAAVSAVQGGDTARLVGLLIALFVISVAALAAAGIRSRRRAGAA